jgi:hypothetical protein
MKLSAITLLTFLLSGFAYAQSSDSATAASQRGNGKQQRMDRFMDADGDGICDQRAKGLGFRRKGSPASLKNLTHGIPNDAQPVGKGKQYRGGKK